MEWHVYGSILFYLLKLICPSLMPIFPSLKVEFSENKVDLSKLKSIFFQDYSRFIQD